MCIKLSKGTINFQMISIIVFISHKCQNMEEWLEDLT